MRHPIAHSVLALHVNKLKLATYDNMTRHRQDCRVLVKRSAGIRYSGRQIDHDTTTESMHASKAV